MGLELEERREREWGGGVGGVEMTIIVVNHKQKKRYHLQQQCLSVSQLLFR